MRGSGAESPDFGLARQNAPSLHPGYESPSQLAALPRTIISFCAAEKRPGFGHELERLFSPTG